MAATNRNARPKQSSCQGAIHTWSEQPLATVRETLANAFFAYSDNYLIDTDHGIIVDVDASRSTKTAEVGAMRKMLDRTEDRIGAKPDWIAADTAYGSSDNLVWLALKRQILPFIPVFDKGERTDGTFSRSDFTWDDENDRYIYRSGDAAHLADLFRSKAECPKLARLQVSRIEIRL